MINRRFIATLTLAALAACGAPDAENAPTAPAAEPTAQPTPATPSEVDEADVLATLRADERFSTFVAAVDAAGLEDTLTAPGRTVFAPTNEAFAALPPGTIDSLMAPANRMALADVLRHHILGETVMSDAIAEAAPTDTLAGTSLEIGRSGNIVTVGEAVVTAPDIEADGGVIHAIDALLIPPAQ